MRKLIDRDLLPPQQFHAKRYTEARFISIGNAHLNYFKNRLNLPDDASVLEIGSGNGRIARALSTHLVRGNYTGFEIREPLVNWCAEAYKNYTNFRFGHINVYNKLYNPHGNTQAKNYRFPLPDGSFDFIYLTSVFTHMLKEDLENYLHEISRMLKPGGLCYITYFLINNETIALMQENRSTRNFKPYDAVSFVIDSSVPERAIAYDVEYIRDAYSRNKLVIADGCPEYGKWRDFERVKHIGYNQDRIAACKEKT